METSVAYKEHVSILKELKNFSGAQNARKPYEEDFEKIYEKASQADVKLSSAKDFLETLSDKEIATLQHYTRLADGIVLDDLSPEGAYNLLMHSYEKYDFDNDGIVQDGIGKNLPVIPQNMDSDTKQAYVQTLNSLDEKDRLMMGMMLSFDTEKFKHDLAKHFKEMSASQRAYINEHANFDVDAFVQETLSEPYHPKPTTYESLQKRVEDIINPTNGGYSSPELKQSASKFLEAFKANYNEIKSQKKPVQTTNEILTRVNSHESYPQSVLEDVLQAV